MNTLKARVDSRLEGMQLLAVIVFCLILSGVCEQGRGNNGLRREKRRDWNDLNLILDRKEKDVVHTDHDGHIEGSGCNMAGKSVFDYDDEDSDYGSADTPSELRISPPVFESSFSGEEEDVDKVREANVYLETVETSLDVQNESSKSIENTYTFDEKERIKKNPSIILPRTKLSTNDSAESKEPKSEPTEDLYFEENTEVATRGSSDVHWETSGTSNKQLFVQIYAVMISSILVFNKFGIN